jgi:hypothetical protein
MKGVHILKLLNILCPLFILLFVSHLASLMTPDVHSADTLHGPLNIACTVCHDTDVPGKGFDHSATGFPLNGMHRSLDCRECHPDLVFRETPRECSACHIDPHNGELGGDCARCHTPVSFTITNDFTGFHDTTRFPLRGAHRTVPCTECHTNKSGMTFRGLSTACVSCHLAEYNATINPNHRTANIPYDCEMCHTSDPGFRAVFEHGVTRFPLTGAHVVLACVDCHSGQFFQSLPTDCITCHRDDFRRTTSPNHTAAGYSENCEHCHTTTAWIPATNTETHQTYPLTGAHLTITCNDCHAEGVYQGTPSSCAACHQDDYDTSVNPSHRALGLALACEDCHTTIAWAPSTFNHTSTGYVLSGAHGKTNCVLCHTAQYGQQPPTACVDCHQNDYIRAANHQTQSFSQDCTECHSTTAWKPSNFTHTGFPIYSGTHRSRWSSCTDCHPSAGNFTVFTCFTCHSTRTHNRNYTSADCLRCHWDGRVHDD